MHFNQVQAVILAAGKSSRFSTQKTKLSFKICGQELILYPIKALLNLKIETTLVLGYQKEAILDILKLNFLRLNNLNYIEQKEQLGTGHALKITQDSWHKDHILIINGDMPLINQDTINKLISKHISNQATVSFIISKKSNLTLDYGKVVTKKNSIQIIEAKNFNKNLKHSYVNAGVYIVKKTFLNQIIDQLQTNKSSGEFYITDLIKIASQNSKRIETVKVEFNQIMGVNTLKELALAEKIKRTEIIEHWMDHGVRFIDPETNLIDANVKLDPDTVIYPGVQIINNSKIASNCIINSYSIIDNSRLEEFINIKPYSIISDSVVKARSEIGPFAHIKQESTISDQTIIGNFVEIKKSLIGEKSKIKHLSYIGDTQTGKEVNIGAGTVTCNYNGFEKNKSIIEDKAFIGANSSLIAPITVGSNSIIGAGSTITKNVPDNSLAISRAQQINKEDYNINISQKIQAEAKLKAKNSLE